MNELNRNVLAFTIALNGYDSLFKSCIESQRQYFQKYLGLNQLVIKRFPIFLSPSESAWLKILVALRALRDFHHDWVVFVDADCDIRDHAPLFIEEFATEYPDKKMFFAHGFSGRINSGVFFIRNSGASVDFLKEILDHADFEVPPEDRAAYENGHVIAFGKNNPHIQIIDFNLWNNNSKLDPNSYIQHYTGAVLRPWYLHNRAPNRCKLIVLKLINKISRKARRFFSGSGGEMNLEKREISAALSEMEMYVDSIIRKYMNMKK